MSTPTISLILAIANNGVIGKDNSLPWHLPNDLQFFKSHTVEKPMIMGRKTFESFKKPLPKRKSLVITRHPENFHYDHPDVSVYSSIESATSAFKEASEIMIIGGAEIYKAAIPFMNRLYITRVNADVGGDTILSEILSLDFSNATKIFEEQHTIDEKHAFPYRFEIWDFH